MKLFDLLNTQDVFEGEIPVKQANQLGRVK